MKNQIQSKRRAELKRDRAAKKPVMTIHTIADAQNGFEIVQTTARTQTAVMVLSPEGHSSEQMNIHKKTGKTSFERMMTLL